jgi:hypothetical protein
MREQGVDLELSYYGHADRLVRLNAETRATDWSMLGSYVCVEAGTRVTLAESDQRKNFHAEGPFGCSEFQLEFLGDRVWRACPVDLPFPPGGILEFDGDGRSFTFSSFRNWLLRFDRC